MSKFGSTVLNVEYLFVQPAFLRCRQHCKREDEDAEDEDDENDEDEDEDGDEAKEDEEDKDTNVIWVINGMQEKPMCF